VLIAVGLTALDRMAALGHLDLSRMVVASWGPKRPVQSIYL
jgi:hypothetical protein